MWVRRSDGEYSDRVPPGPGYEPDVTVTGLGELADLDLLSIR